MFDQNAADSYSIDCGQELREKEGLVLVGDLQQAIRNETIQRIDVDLSILEWIDPLPLLMLLGVLGEFSKRHKKKGTPSVTIDFGGHDVGSNNHKLCLKFLSSHGFVRLFSEVGAVKWRGIVESVDPATGEIRLEERSYTEGSGLIDVLMRHSHSQAFTNSVLLPATGQCRLFRPPSRGHAWGIQV